jgi:hypothetical protein
LNGSAKISGQYSPLGVFYFSAGTRRACIIPAGLNLRPDLADEYP